ncbi:E3 ubiquitin-protein ligase RMA1H1-like [Andrographis paniculata]|uniref:E3 ubiquitin-protein ligase RMA1H1-like n=1 Tax=Andrographis paniculata TaxID=175694 RepID=UPI0021E6FFA3|nr:E3 ubiquitin-protein ligase RMA1H1-like [Andrographis paniculata]
MAFEQYFVRDWNSIPASAPTTHSDKSSTCFDCNICLDLATDPVVTLCGHLYCWPCIYKWLDTQTASLPSGQLPRCPVCKAETSEKTMVPLYGRGQPLSEPDSIPPRPPASGIQALTDFLSRQPSYDPYQQQYLNQYIHPGYSGPRLNNIRSSVSHPLVGMLGEMVHARVFGNAASGLYAYPNSPARSITPRLRRREIEADKSLNRISIFLFCCFLLCLLLF